MKLRYKNKEIELKECINFYDRLKGFMFTKRIDKALLFNHCSSIHTFFMKTNIDVIMCNKNNKILYYYHNLEKNKIILPKRYVYKTIELPVDFYDIKINDIIEIK